MKLKDFAYDLPKNLVAQEPMKPRDSSRLLVLDKKTGRIKHRHFYEIINYLRKGDVLVLNNTKVMPARLIGRRAGTGGRVEIFLLRQTPLNPLTLRSGQAPLSGGRVEAWQCLVGGKKRKENLKVEFGQELKAEIIRNNHDGTWQVKFNKSGARLMKIVEKIGQVPLPPYIKRDSALKSRHDIKAYQTVYADEKKLGSVAAPTAGFHFTKKLINRLKKKGVQFEYVTLQVGLGTFAPIKSDDITKHQMHAEWLEISKKTLISIIKAKSEGRRIIAVGTTATRTLESVFSRKELRVANYELRDYSAWTDIFIYPGYKFKAVDAMITNFHLPKSTLLMLVSAFTGRREILNVYREAIKKKYRFYSYGDAMLII